MGVSGNPIMRAPKETIANARRLRRNLSAPEARLGADCASARREWRRFVASTRSAHTCSISFCARARLAIEIDGISHDMGDRPQRDIRRDAWLEAQGLTVLRIAAGELPGRLDAAVDGIVRMAALIEAKASNVTL